MTTRTIAISDTDIAALLAARSVIGDAANWPGRDAAIEALRHLEAMQALDVLGKAGLDMKYEAHWAAGRECEGDVHRFPVGARCACGDKVATVGRSGLPVVAPYGTSASELSKLAEAGETASTHSVSVEFKPKTLDFIRAAWPTLHPGVEFKATPVLESMCQYIDAGMPNDSDDRSRQMRVRLALLGQAGWFGEDPPRSWPYPEPGYLRKVPGMDAGLQKYEALENRATFQWTEDEVRQAKAAGAVPQQHVNWTTYAVGCDVLAKMLDREIVSRVRNLYGWFSFDIARSEHFAKWNLMATVQPDGPMSRVAVRSEVTDKDVMENEMPGAPWFQAIRLLACQLDWKRAPRKDRELAEILASAFEIPVGKAPDPALHGEVMKQIDNLLQSKTAGPVTLEETARSQAIRIMEHCEQSVRENGLCGSYYQAAIDLGLKLNDGQFPIIYGLCCDAMGYGLRFAVDRENLASRFAAALGYLRSLADR